MRANNDLARGAFYNLIMIVCGFLLGFAFTNDLRAQSDDLNQPKLGTHMQWRSESKNDEQLARALEKLYLTLYNTMNMPTKTIVDEKGSLVETILRREGLYSGAYFPNTVDSVICDLNPKHCQRERIEVPKGSLESVDSHIGGYKSSEPNWTNSAGSHVVLPDLEFSNYTWLTPVKVVKGVFPSVSSAAGTNLATNCSPWTLTCAWLRFAKLQEDEFSNLFSALRTNAATDCSSWSLTCEELTRRLNPLAFRGKSKGGTPWQLIAPVSGVQTELAFVLDERSKVAGILHEIGEESLYRRLDLKPQSDALLFAEPWKHYLAQNNPLDIAVEALSPQLVSIGKAAVQTAAGELVGQGQQPLFRLIGHPYDDPENTPLEFQRPVLLAIFDTWLDKDHCALSNNIDMEAISQASLRETPNQTDQCGQMNENPNLPHDHGTHVVGLIAAAPNEHQQTMVGLNPSAKIKFAEIDINQLVGHKYREDIATKITNLSLRHDTKAVNVSWRYTNEMGGLDAIARSIFAVKGITLIVVAAGNSNSHFDTGACNELPACLTNLENVLTVVGLDRQLTNPELWRDQTGRGSNSSQDFHIAAIAKDVLSTTSGNFMGRFSGTSQAAPQVTAAASLLYSIHEAHFRAEEPNLPPVRVKNRLIYTADLFTSLLEHSQSGRLNVGRALNVSNAYVKVKNSGDDTVEALVGTISQFGNDSRDEHILCRTSRYNEVRIARRDLRRMFFDENRQKYIIFRNSIAGDRNSPVERIVDCQLRTTTHEAIIVTDRGPIKFEFWQVLDYISPMFD